MNPETRVILLSVVLALSACSQGRECESAESKVAGLYYQGLKHFGAKEYKQAMPFFEQVVALDPDFVPAYVHWRRAFKAIGNYTSPRALKLERVLVFGDTFLCPDGNNSSDMASARRVFDLGQDRFLLFCGFQRRNLQMPKYDVLDMGGLDIWYYDTKTRQQKKIYETGPHNKGNGILVRDYVPDDVAARFDEAILFDYETNLPEIWKPQRVVCDKATCRIEKNPGCEFRHAPKSYLGKIKKHLDLTKAWRKSKEKLTTAIIAAALYGDKRALAAIHQQHPEMKQGRCGCDQHWERELVDAWATECKGP